MARHGTTAWTLHPGTLRGKNAWEFRQGKVLAGRNPTLLFRVAGTFLLRLDEPPFLECGGLTPLSFFFSFAWQNASAKNLAKVAFGHKGRRSAKGKKDRKRRQTAALQGCKESGVKPPHSKVQFSRRAPLGLSGKAVKSLSRKSPRGPKTENVETVRRQDPVTAGRADEAGRKEPRAAPQDTAISVIYT